MDRDTEGKPLERRVGKVVVCPQVHLGQSPQADHSGADHSGADHRSGSEGDRSGFEMWI